MKFAPAGMNPTGQHIATPDGAVTFWGNGSLRLRLYMEKGPLVITMRAGGNVVDGEAPRIVVALDGHVVDTVGVDSPQHRDYKINTRVAQTGTKLLELSFTNHLAKPNPLAGRTLYIEAVWVHQDS